MSPDVTWVSAKDTLKEYLIDHFVSRNYQEAKLFCERLFINAGLPVIRNQLQNDVIHELIKRSPSRDNVYLGTGVRIGFGSATFKTGLTVIPRE